VVLKLDTSDSGQKYMERFAMWCWRRMEISWTDRVRNEEVLYSVKDERHILHTVLRRKANWIARTFRRNRRLKHVIEGKTAGRIEMTGRRGRRFENLLNERREGRRYGKPEEEALGRILWRSRFGRACGPVVRQTTN
jgi:hypothetical protein